MCDQETQPGDGLVRRAGRSSAARRIRTKPDAGSVSVRPSHEPTPTIRGPACLGDDARAGGARRAPRASPSRRARPRAPRAPGAARSASGAIDAARERGDAAARRRQPAPSRRAAPTSASVAEHARHRRPRQSGRARDGRDRTRRDARRGTRAPGTRAGSIRCARRRGAAGSDRSSTRTLRSRPPGGRNLAAHRLVAVEGGLEQALAAGERGEAARAARATRAAGISPSISTPWPVRAASSGPRAGARARRAPAPAASAGNLEPEPVQRLEHVRPGPRERAPSARAASGRGSRRRCSTCSCRTSAWLWLWRAAVARVGHRRPRSRSPPSRAAPGRSVARARLLDRREERRRHRAELDLEPERHAAAGRPGLDPQPDGREERVRSASR